MTVRHPFTRSDVTDAVALAAHLASVLGRPVAVGSMPAYGHADPGPPVLILEDPATGEPLDLDGTLVAQAVASYVPPAAELSPAQRLRADLENVTTVAGLRAVLLAYADAEVAREQALAERIRHGIGRLS